ncbi:MAG: alkaline phosphatase family protein [Candidatus Eiseniibacteriota bacterium]
MSRRVLVIALDGTTFDLIGPWLDDGSMPNLARLRAEGVSGPLRSILPPVTAPAWCSFMTGKNPAKHGVFEFFLREPGGFEEIPVSSSTRAGATLWELIGESGKKVLVVNVPVTYPPTPVDGCLVGDFLTPMGKRDFTYPAGLLDEIEAATGPYQLYHVEVYRPGRGRIVLDELDRVLEANRRANLWLLRNKEWDFAMLHVWGTDRYGHELWHVLDAAHPAHDPAETLILSDRCRAYWRKVDEVVGEWIAEAPDAVHVVLSDHGFGPIHHFLVFNVWLLQRGYLRLRRNAATFVKRTLFELGISPALGYRAAMKLGFARMRLAAGVGTRRRLLDRVNRVFLSLSDVDWSRTRVYSKGNYGQLFLNLAGREPHGIVHPGAEADAMLDEVSAALREIRDPETGGALVRDVWRKEQLYHGPFLDRAPDLTFLPADMRNKALGTVDFTSHRFVERAYGNSGDHRMNGILLLRGEGIRRGERLEGARLIDVSPTILHWLGMPIPSDFDGRVLAEAFTDRERAARPVRVVEPRAVPGRTGAESPLTAEEQREIRERLKRMGYLG